MLVEVTDHAAERYRQRVRGTLEAKAEIATRVSKAYAEGRHETGPRGVMVRDRQLPGLSFVCRPEGGRLIVITLWEDDAVARVPKRFTDALRRTDAQVGDAPRHAEDRKPPG